MHTLQQFRLKWVFFLMLLPLFIGLSVLLLSHPDSQADVSIASKQTALLQEVANIKQDNAIPDSLATSPMPAPSQVLGALDLITCDTIRGWAGDTADPNRPVDIHLYIDGPAGGGGRFIKVLTASRVREQAVCEALQGSNCDLCPFNHPQCKHGFEFNISNGLLSLSDGITHTIYAYGLNFVDEFPPLLSGSSQEIKCHALALPMVVQTNSSLKNGDFDTGDFSQWTVGQGSFNGNGTGLPQTVVFSEDNWQALIGDIAATNNTTPVGYGYIAQTFTVGKPMVRLRYRINTYDVVWGENTNKLFDTFEISINKLPDQVTDEERQLKCDLSNARPTMPIVVSNGLSYCDGYYGNEVGTKRDLGWQEITLDLQEFQGQSITLYAALWSREYETPFYDDQAHNNTWVNLDDIQPLSLGSGTGWIAYTSSRDGNNNVYIMNIDTKQEIQLTDDPAADQRPIWSPTEERIAFISDRDGDFEIYTMNLDGSGLLKVTNNEVDDSHPAWSPDGTKLVYESGDIGQKDIYTINKDGTNPNNLTNNPAHDIQGFFSPDGSRIVFSSNRDGDGEIYMMNIDGGDLKQLTDFDDAADNLPVWSPDGRWIAFVSNRDGDDEIFLIDLQNNNDVVKLTDDNVSSRLPDWSPDGLHIIFNADGTNSTEIYVMDVLGRSRKQLTFNESSEFQPTWQHLLD
ncbi:MAG: hypothetical protein AAF629_29300 [Chloroflexota bacterium]